MRINFLALRYDIKKISAGLAIIASFFYLKIAGSPIPAQRALIMVWMVSLSLLLDKKFYGDGYFNLVHIFSPTFNDDATYRELEKHFDKYKPKLFKYEVHNEIDVKVVEDVIEEQKEDIENLGKKYAKRVLLLFEMLS